MEKMERSPSSSQANDKQPSAPFHSQPSDLELVKSYLRPWVDSAGIKKAGDFIHVSDVYAAGPATLSLHFEPAVAQNGDRAWYFFSPLHRKAGGKRNARTVATGEGWYHNESRPKPVVDALDGDRHVGYRQTFTFMSRDDDGVRFRTGWLMMELRLGSQKQDPAGGIVLCKVYRSPRHHGGEPSPRGARRKREAADEDDESCESPRAKGKSDDDGEGSDGTASRKKSDGEGSSAATVVAAAPGKAEHWHEIPVTASVAAPGRKGKEANDEGSAETSATASDSKQKASAGDEGSIAASAAEPARGKRKIDDSQLELHCPRCGCHLDAEEVLAAAKSKQEETKPEMEIVHVEGDSSVIEHSFHRFF